MWNQLEVNASNFDFWHYNLIDWLSLIARSNDKLHDTGLPWKVVFPFAIWNVWKSRITFIFNGKARSPKLVVDIVHQAKEYIHCVATPRLGKHRITRYIRWERPEQGWKKLNTNGACRGLHGLAGCGGLVRSADGQWVAGFSRRIRVTSSFAAKLWGLREGLQLCCNLNISYLEVEMDDCRQLINRFQQIRADVLAKISLRMTADFLCYDSPPVDILDVFERDLNGMYSVRICHDSSFVV